MAQLMKRGKQWYVRFQHGGKDYWRSTKKEKKSDARIEGERIVAEVKGEVSLSTLFDQVLAGITLIDDVTDRDRTRREYARRLLQGTTSKLAVADAWDTWLSNPGKGRRGDPKESTLAGYSAIWNRFAREHKDTKRRGWLPRVHSGVRFLHEVTNAMADDYATDLWGSGITPATYNAHVKFLRSMFKTLSIKAGIDVNPWERIRTIEKETESKRALTEDELATVLRNATGDLRHWFLIGIYTGFRLGDVVTLRWDEINLDKKVIARVPLKVDRKKGQKRVTCPMHPVLEALLTELRTAAADGDVYLFPDAVKVYRRDRGDITDRVQAFFEKTCGIKTTEDPSNGHRRRAVVRVGFHSLRHSFVSLCAANRVPQVAIMELVGHGSPAMTQLYMHAETDQQRKAIAALPAEFLANGKHDHEEGEK